MSHKRLHSDEHSENGADELNAGNLGSGAAVAGQQLIADGSGGIDWNDKEHGHMHLGVYGWLRSGDGEWGYYLYEARSRMTNGHYGGSANRSGSLFRDVVLPVDFKNFVKIQIETYIFGGTPDSFDLTMTRGGTADSVVDAVDVTPSTTDVFEVTEIVPGDSYSIGDALLLELQSTCDSGVYAELSSCRLVYER